LTWAWSKGFFFFYNRQIKWYY